MLSSGSVDEIKGYSDLLNRIIKQGLTGFVKIEDVKGDF